ncbi:MAG: UPF0489 family protein [Candidatus Omnitrophica bacterium]|nr:UPF0489 family protein [Candidatus Omnitrophota bacterium]
MSALQKFYHGFFIDTPVGNNAFSFDQRINKRIYVPSLIGGSVSDIALGREIVFSNIVEGAEVNTPGLARFVHDVSFGQDIFIFDNHNHAFAFWAEALAQGVFPKGLPLVHVDQHKDTRVPEKSWDGQDPFRYANMELNVGNFISPAIKAGFFSDVIHVAAPEAFQAGFPAHFVLDIDLDIFSPVMDYIPYDLKMNWLKEALKRASFVTIATSPFFLEQDEAVYLIKELLIERDRV